MPGDALRRVAGAAALVETHLVRNAIVLASQARQGKVLLHGHCHQKALVGIADTLRILAMVPGTESMLVDSGCCRMAGSFGYEHYDLSMKIGARVLFPAVRGAGDSTILAPASPAGIKSSTAPAAARCIPLSI